MVSLEDKVVVVAGGTRGFGAALVEAFVTAGARVVFCGRDPAAVAAAEARFTTHPAVAPANVGGMVCDVGDLSQVGALATFARERFGTFDVWINNAGVSGPYGEVETLPPDRFEAVVGTNILGTYHGTIVALRHFLPRGDGKVINVLGFGADGRPAPFQTAYGPTKAWVQSFTRSVAAEHEKSGVGVFAFSPGMMLTELMTSVESTSPAGEARLRRLPGVLSFLAQAPDVPAQRAVWLASSATDGKTGLVVREFGRRKMLLLAWGGVLRRFRGRGSRPRVDVRPLEPWDGSTGT
jgi:glucose 1-dehydrogenase